MKIDITGLLNGRVKKIDIDYGYVPEDNGTSPLLPDDIHLTSPVSVVGDVRDLNGFLTVDLTVRAEYTTQCARCLDEIKKSIEFDLKKIAVEDSDDSDEVGSDDVIGIVNGRLDMDDVITEQLAIELPPYSLCSEDCQGLCPKCGLKIGRDCRCG